MDPSNKLNADCIILAAGLSSRMGSWKMLLPYHDGTLLDAAIVNALAVCQRVLLVGGYRYDALQARYKNHTALTLLCNPDYPSGLLSSIKVGVAHSKTDRFFIAHGDMPCLYPRFYELLWQQRGYTAVFPGTPALPGHPVLLSSTIIPSVLHATANSTMRQVIIRAGNTHYLGLTDPLIVSDVDTPASYQVLLKKDKSI